MASKDEKICHILSFLVMLVYFRIVTTTNIDCGGKPFHCVNSTHFMICVDLGFGVSKTVNDFMIQCPSSTVCRESNILECEYLVPTTTESIIRQGEENIKVEPITYATTDSPFKKTSVAILRKYDSTTSTTAKSVIITDTQILQPSAVEEIREISANINDIASTTEKNLTITDTNLRDNLITTSTITTSVDKSEPLELFKTSKYNLFHNATISPIFEKIIETNTTSNITNQTNILHNLEVSGEKALYKNETPYMETADTLLHNKTTEQITIDMPTMSSQYVPYSYNSDLNIPTIKTLPDFTTLTITNYLNKGNVFKDTSKVNQELNSKVTTKMSPQYYATTNTNVSEDVNLTSTENYKYGFSRMKNQTSSGISNLVGQRTEMIEKSFFPANATENIMLLMQDNDISKYTTSNSTLTKDIIHVNPSFNTSFSIANNNKAFTPVTTIPLFTTFNRIKFIKDPTVSNKVTESPAVSYSTNNNNLNLSQYEVNTNTPLEAGVEFITTNTSNTAHVTKNSTITTSVVSSTAMKAMTMYLLQNQTTTETSLTDLDLSSLINETSKLANNKLTQASGFTTVNSAGHYETTKGLITEFTREPILGYNVTKSSNLTGLYISTNIEKSIFNKTTKGFVPSVPKFSMVNITTPIDNSKINIAKNERMKKYNSVNISNTMLLLEDQPTSTRLKGKKNSSTENPIITKMNISVFESLLNTDKSPIEIAKEIIEKPYFPSNTDINDTVFIKYQTTLGMNFPTEVYELLTDEINISEKNTTNLFNENYIVEPIRTTNMSSKNDYVSESKVTAEIITDTSLALINTVNGDTKLLSQDQITKEKSFIESHISTNENYMENTEKNILESAVPTITSGIQTNKVHVSKFDESINTIKIDIMLPLQNQITHEGIVVKDFYSSRNRNRTEMSKKLPFVPVENNLANVSNNFTVVSVALSTTSSVIENETLVSQKLPFVKIDKYSSSSIVDKIITKLDTINKNIIKNDSIPSLNDTVIGPYTTSKNISIQQQTLPPSYIENSPFTIKMANITAPDTKIILTNTQTLSDNYTYISTVSPEMKPFKTQSIVTDIYNRSNGWDATETTNINNLHINPKSNVVIDIFPTVLTSESILVPKIYINNKNITKFVDAKNESLNGQLKDDQQISQVILQNTEATANNIVVYDETNLSYINKEIINHTAKTQLKSFDSIAIDEVNFSASNIVTTTNPHVGTENTVKMLQNNNNINKVDVVDKVDSKVTKDTITDSILVSLIESTHRVPDPTSNIVTTINPQDGTENIVKMFQNNNNMNKVNVVIGNTVNNKVAEETTADSVLGSLIESIDRIQVSNGNIVTTKKTPKNTQFTKEAVSHSNLDSSLLVSRDQIHVPTRSIITTTYSQATTENAVNMFKNNNNTENKVDVVISDLKHNKVIKETIADSVLGSLIESTDRVQVLTKNIVTTINSQIETQGTVKMLQNNNNIVNKVDVVIDNTVNNKIINEIIPDSILGSFTESTDRIQGTTENIVTTIMPPMNTQFVKETVVHSALDSSISATTDQIHVPTRNILTTINSQAATENIVKMFKNNNNIANRVDELIGDTVHSKVTKEIVANSIFRSLIESTNRVQVPTSTIVTTRNPQALTENTIRMFQNHNNINKLDVVIGDTVNTQPVQETIANYVLSSLTPASMDNIEVLASNKIISVNPQMVISSTEKILKYNKDNFETQVDMVISDTGNSRSPEETTVNSGLGTLTPTSPNKMKVLNTIVHPVLSSTTPASTDKVNVSTSNKFTFVTPQAVRGSTEKKIENNIKNNLKNKLDMIIRDTGNIRSSKEIKVHSVLLGSLSTSSTKKTKYSANNKTTTRNPHTVTENKVAVINTDTVNIQTAKETITDSVLNTLTPASIDEIKVSLNNIITTINPTVVNETTEKTIQTIIDNTKDKKLINNNSVNIQHVKETTHSILGSLTPALRNDVKVFANKKFTTTYPQNETKIIKTIFENINNNNFKNEVDVVVSDTVNTQLATEIVGHSLLESLTIASKEKNKVMGSNTLTTMYSQIATPYSHTGTLIENNNNFENEQRIGILVSLPTSTTERYKGIEKNTTNELNAHHNESVTFFIDNQTPELSFDYLDIKYANDLLPNNISNHKLYNISYEKVITKEFVSTLSPVLHEKNKLDNPLLLTTSETLRKRDSNINNLQIGTVGGIAHKDDNIFVVPTKPIHSPNKRHKQLLNRTTLPQTYLAGKELHNNSQNINVVVTNNYKNISNIDLFTCQNRFRGRYADENDCRKFYICIGRNQPLLGECPVNTVFSEIRKQCTKNLSHCIRHNQFRCIQSGRFSDVFKSNIYYICVQNKNALVRFQFHCQDSYHLNKKTVKCVRDIKSQQITSTVDNDSNIESSQSKVEMKSKERKLPDDSDKTKCKKEGKFPDLRDCRKYYVCTKKSKSVFRRRTKKCDSDEVFHPEKKKCVDSDSYECD